MIDMEKDGRIQRELQEYFDGNRTPQVELSAAKRALFEETVARRRRKRTLISVLSTAAAVLLLVVTVGILPIFQPKNGNGFFDGVGGQSPAPPMESEGDNSISGTGVYSMATAPSKSVGYGELISYGTLFEPFARMTEAGAVCTYTLYGKEDWYTVGTEITLSTAELSLTAVVYTDLTDGNELPQEILSYLDLEDMGGYCGETVPLEGEYCSRLLWFDSAVRFGKVYSESEGACAWLISYFNCQ